VKDQCDSYRYLQSLTSAPGIPQNVFSNIKTKYQQKYPDNYSMQKALILDQFNSYRDLNK
jgi:hypothetical protein